MSGYLIRVTEDTIMADTEEVIVKKVNNEFGRRFVKETFF